MTRRPWMPLDRPALLQAALNRYRVAFPERELPDLHGIVGLGEFGGEVVEVAAEMLLRAVVRNEPLNSWSIKAALGLRRPSPDTGT
jgi:hypothetical protein